MIINYSVIDRHSADDGGTLGRKLPPEFLGIPKGAEVHNGFCPHFYCIVDFFKFHIQIFPVSGSAKINIDLCLQHGTDRVGLQAGMKLIGRDHRFALGHKFLEFSYLYLFFFCGCFHLGGNDPLAGSVHLCCVAHRFSSL